jgi:hypothetical protein
MRYCRTCRSVTAGHPQYCASCGRTYDHKLCPRRHRNARQAEFCVVCGSIDLSSPQRARNVREQIVARIVYPLAFVILVAASALSAVLISGSGDPLPLVGLALLWLLFLTTGEMLR